MAVVVRVFLMKAQSGTDSCVGAAALLKSRKVKSGRFIPPLKGKLHPGPCVQENCSSDSHSGVSAG